MNDTLEPGEVHPSSYPAMDFINTLRMNPKSWMKHIEAISSTALSGNRLAQVCLGTITRLEMKEPVSDRYLLGLAWLLRELEDKAISQKEPPDLLEELTKLSQEMGLYE